VNCEDETKPEQQILSAERAGKNALHGKKRLNVKLRS